MYKSRALRSHERTTMSTAELLGLWSSDQSLGLCFSPLLLHQAKPSPCSELEVNYVN